MISGLFVYAQVKNWGDCVVDGVATLKCFEVLISNLITISTALVVVVLFIMFVIGSLKYLISGGDPEKIKGAKGTLTYALIGLILFISAFLILNIIQVLFLGGASTTGPKLYEFSIPRF